MPATVTQAQDIGTYWLVTAQLAGERDSCARASSPEQAIPQVGERGVAARSSGAHTCYYRNEELIADRGGAA